MSNEQVARGGRAFMRVLLCAILILSCSVGLRAQSTYGALTGTVVDQTGAAVIDATVTLTNVGTSEKQTQATGETGLYSFVNLYPGQYRLTIDKAGFRKVDRQNVVIQVQQTTRIDIPLSVGQATNTCYGDDGSATTAGRHVIVGPGGGRAQCRRTSSKLPMSSLSSRFLPLS